MADRIIKIFHKGLEAQSLTLGKFILWQPKLFDSVEATGGSIYEFTDSEGIDWRVHILSLPGINELEITNGGKLAWKLCGAGGGGGSRHGGGGGGGGIRGDLTQPFEFIPGIYSASIGIGGNGAISGASENGGRGENSTFLGETAAGGGAGCSANSKPAVADGGCGGGGRGLRSYAGIGSQGFNGGQGGDGRTGGGGGSMYEKGGDGNSPGNQGKGAEGVNLSPFIGSLFDFGYAAAGGGGGGDEPISSNVGGLGGGGNGGTATTEPTPGQYGSGGGGGGMVAETNENRHGEKGGDGWLVIRYPLNRLPDGWQ